MMDDTALLQEQFSSIRALFLTAVNSRAGIELDSKSVQNLDARLQGYQALLRNFVQELEVLRFTEAVRLGQPTQPTFVVSDAIEQLLNLMRPAYGSGQVTLEGAVYDAIVNGLDGIHERATRVERQLDAFRDLEAARFDTGVMEEVATSAAGELLIQGKVIRPNFGGRS